MPAEWKNYTPINAEFFNDDISGIGSPGGAAQVGPVDKDHPLVVNFQAEKPPASSTDPASFFARSRSLSSLPGEVLASARR